LASRKPIPRPVRAARNAAQRLYDTFAGVEQLQTQVSALSDQVAELRVTVAALGDQARTEQDALRSALQSGHRKTLEALRLVYDDESTNRQRLWRVRESDSYARAFDEPEPLVSILMVTYSNLELLMERALPSLLAQTYERIEVVIVGDGAAPDVEAAIKSVHDPRVRYRNLTMRGPYPDDQIGLWQVAGGPAMNEAVRIARGAWIAQSDDDDAAKPDRIEKLVRAARDRDLEFCYGKIDVHAPDGTTTTAGKFPPEYMALNLGASLMHAGLRFICSELGDATFGVPGDWSRISRMMRIGVRMGMIDDVVVDYYPGHLWQERGNWRPAPDPGIASHRVSTEATAMFPPRPGP